MRGTPGRGTYVRRAVGPHRSTVCDLKGVTSMSMIRWVRAALQSHCTAEMEIAPSKVPDRKGKPCPKSPTHRSPSTSLSKATSSIASLMSMPCRLTKSVGGQALVRCKSQRNARSPNICDAVQTCIPRLEAPRLSSPWEHGHDTTAILRHGW